MRQELSQWRFELQASMRTTANMLECWGRHEWNSLQGHRVELVERLQLARQARSLADLMRDQWDLVPESRRRLQRNADTRRAILAELGSALRQTLQSRS